MRDPLGLGRGGPLVVRSQLAMEIALNVVALAGGAVLVRALLRALGVDHRVWIGATVYRFTDPVVAAFALLPGGDRRLIGDATLADVTLVALLALVPLALLARAKRPPS